MADNQRRTPSTRSPLAGCSIIIIGIAAMAFLIVFVIWNLFKLDEEISKFTTDTAIPTPLPDLVEHMSEFNELKSRLEIFKDASGNGEDTTLTLSPEDINLTIAAFDEFKELRNTFSVTAIQDGKLHITISFPLRGKPMEEGMRYLNGTMIATPKLSGDEIILEIHQIIVPDAIVPDGFIGQLSPYRLSQKYLEDPFLGPWMKRLTALSTQDGALLLTINAADAAQEELPEDTSPYIRRFLLVSGASVAGFFGIVLIFVVLNKRRKGPTDPTDDPPTPIQL